MASRSYDFVVFGASGFTGQFVVDEVSRIVDEVKLKGGKLIKWAIAGRSMGKMQNVLSESSRRTGRSLEETPIIIADTSNEQSLEEMCQQTVVLLNCVGPYNLYGEPVVRACIESKAHYLDISGEPRFLERVQLLYNQKAKEAGVYVVSTCGWDSIPADMGIVHLEHVFDGDINSVEMFIDVQGGPEGVVLNTGTFNSAVNGIASANELKGLRKSLFPNPLPKPRHKMKKRSLIFYSDEVKKWCIPFPGSDKSVVYRSQRYKYDVLEHKPIQFTPYFCMPSLWHIIGLFFFGIFFALLTKFSFGRKLLMMYPSFFSGGMFKKGGPSEKQMEGVTFTSTFVAEGYSKKSDSADDIHIEPPNKTITTTVTGPEPGYVCTPICLVQSAVTLLEDKEKLPKEGGVYTPASVFGNTGLIDRLCKHGVVYELKA